VKRIIISDLHIGSSYCKEEQLAEFLDVIECDELVLAGDVIDFIKIPSFSPSSIRILRSLRKFERIIYIVGNHDVAFEDCVNCHVGNIEFMSKYEFVEAAEGRDARKFRIVHGDEYDPSWLHRHTEGFLIKMISLCQDWIERTFKIDLTSWWANRNIKKRKLIRIWDIINLNSDVDVFIMGHSHKPECVIWVDENQVIKTYVNSGDWVYHMTYVEIEDGIVRLRKYES
jgi:UDP-2,3-diacylglucosamine pyrophosphatase LpxH